LKKLFRSGDWQVNSCCWRRLSSMTRKRTAIAVFIVVLLLAAPLLARTQAGTAQTAPASQAPPAYQPKFSGDPARSDSESAALAYMRVVIRAQKQFNKQYGHYATSLNDLVHSGSFTKRMVDPNRGDYTVGFKGKNDSYVLSMTPSHLDAEHRSFYAEEDGKIHADEEKPADEKSPVVK
jgi:hypothetical protein